MTPTQIVDQAPPPPGTAIRVSVGGRAIAVFNLGSTLHAIDAACTHVRGPLERGRVEGTVVTCPLHGSQFDLQTGAVRRGPAAQAVKTYPVRIENGKLALEIP
ncbi:MAG: non-heme iron oxygenase ferredoxin subunit [Thermoplasmata archaeon]|nr:non-heme iron oxygenase ferredoxin subunit [Thermoplasmata archaeon]